MIKIIVLLILLFISTSLLGTDVLMTFAKESSDYILSMSSKSRYFENSLAYKKAGDKSYKRYDIKFMYDWKKLSSSLYHANIEEIDVNLIRLEVTYLLEKTWLLSADVGIAEQWEPHPSTNIVVKKSLSKELSIGLINAKLGWDSRMYTSDFIKYITENKVDIRFMLGKLDIGKIHIPGVSLYISYKLNYYGEMYDLVECGFYFSL